MRKRTQIMDGRQVERSVRRMAHEIIERNRGAEGVALIGIRRGGEPIAQMLAEAIERVEGARPPVGAVDASLYRDDRPFGESPSRADAPFEINERTVVLVDDVLHTGRTVRAAMEAVMQMGRARRIQLAVLVDRGHRELPIRADFVGKNIPTAQAEFVQVCLDGGEADAGVWLLGPEA